LKPASPWRALTPLSEEPRRRLDAWLAFKLEGLSRRKAQRLIDSGQVTVDGQTLAKGSPIEAGVEVCIWVAPDPVDWVPWADSVRPRDVV
jgi:ribosomal 50S subunit-recycling heat shock protein